MFLLPRSQVRANRTGPQHETRVLRAATLKELRTTGPRASLVEVVLASRPLHGGRCHLRKGVARRGALVGIRGACDGRRRSLLHKLLGRHGLAITTTANCRTRLPCHTSPFDGILGFRTVVTNFACTGHYIGTDRGKCGCFAWAARRVRPGRLRRRWVGRHPRSCSTAGISRIG